ncbi:RNase adapter RapZ [Acidimangrovimonas sediminis]|uniref:RNase adapter RapZ n=1 Tax=Acidimangrovimonas sediminis TaxID=2056283 RepID=UPI000C80F293|nr:RNase adapter RapZ [Acidimangrovimonas sediminis]
MSTGEAGHRLVLVTGPSGAGRSTAIAALEDLGAEAIDNLPLSLVPRLLDGPPLARPLALGIDVRNRDFSASATIDLIDTLTRRPDVALELLFLDCTEDELIRRYAQTRRRHPLAPDGDPAQGVLREADLLTPIRARADVLIDTSDLTPHDLRAELERWFAPADGGPRMAVSVHSFSYRRGVPRGVDMIFDVRFLRNPHWDPALRAQDGRDPAVAAYIWADPNAAAFFDKIVELLAIAMPAQLEEGKPHLAIGFGCTGGQHRSVAMAEKLAHALAQQGWAVSKRHRELERRAANAAPEGRP